MSVPTFLQVKIIRRRRIVSALLMMLFFIPLGFGIHQAIAAKPINCFQKPLTAVYRDYRECFSPFVILAVPTFIQTKTGAEDSSASTTATITPNSAIRAQGGSIGPSTGVVALSFDGDPGTVTATDTAGNTWYSGTSAGSGSTWGVMLYSFNMAGGVIPTINVSMTNSVKKKWAFAELDQVAPISPYDGSSSPLDATQERVDTTSSTIRTSSPASPAPPKIRGMIGVRIGAIAWNNTRTVTGTSAWTGLVQLSGGSSNLGVAIERKAVEIQNIAGGNSRASFTMSGVANTDPAAVMSLTFYRDGVLTGNDQEGSLDNIEGVVTEYHDTLSFTYRSSASAPNGGTGGSQYSQSYSFQPRYYAPSGVTIADSYNVRMLFSDGYDDGLQYFGFYYKSFSNDEIGSTLETTDWDYGGAPNIDGALGGDVNVSGAHLLALSRSADWNDDGMSVLKISEEGDGLGSGTSNYVNIGNYYGNVPMYAQFTLTYPVLATIKDPIGMVGVVPFPR